MKLKRASLALAVPVTALVAAATPAVSASAAPVHPVTVPCHTWVSTSQPKDYSTVDVWVATAFVIGLIFAPRFTRLVAGSFTALAGADFLQLAYAWAQQAAEG